MPKLSLGHSHLLVTIKGKAQSLGNSEANNISKSNSLTKKEIYFPLPGAEVSEVFTKYSSCFATTESGQLFSWGNNYCGKLGLGSNDKKIKTPRQVNLNNNKVSAIDCGSTHAVFLTTAGKLYSVGSNSEGQLGIEAFSSKISPHAIGFNETPVINNFQPINCNFFIKKIKVGNYHNLALTLEGKVLAWGFNIFGQLGLGHNHKIGKPELVNIQETIIDIAAGLGFSAFLTKEGEVYVSGQIANTWKPIKLNWQQIITIQASQSTLLALNNEGKLFSFGFQKELVTYLAKNDEKILTMNCSADDEIIALLDKNHQLYMYSKEGKHPDASPKMPVLLEKAMLEEYFYQQSKKTSLAPNVSFSDVSFRFFQSSAQGFTKKNISEASNYRLFQ